MKSTWIITFYLLLLNVAGVSAQHLSAAEYFWDTDPGQGSGTTMTATDGSFSSRIEEALATVSSLPSTGTHIFNIRFKDSSNHWGPRFKTVVVVQPSVTVTRDIKVTQAECWWDADPGQGNGTAMVAFDGSFNQSIEALYKSGIIPPVSNGNHTFSIRAKDVAGNWGPVFKTIVVTQPNVSTVREIKITAGEYFFDTDPGNGNANALLALDGNFNQSLEAIYQNFNTTSFSVGQHVLNIRVRDAANNWGPVFRTVIDVLPNISSVRNIKVTAAEYFFDTDPGNGNATPMISYDGNFNASLEAIAGAGIPQPVAQGVHVLYLRVKDVENNWGPKFGVVVNLDTSINAFTTIVSGTSFLCTPLSNPQTYSAPFVSGNTYVWTASGGTIASGQGTNSITVNWSGTGLHQVKVIECNSSQTFCDSDFISVNIQNSQTINRTRNICDGDSVFVGSSWIKTPGVFQNSYTSSNGCDSTVVTTVNVNSVYHIQHDVVINSGDSVFVGGSWQKLPGTYYDFFSTTHNCDSIITTVVTFPTSIEEHLSGTISIYPNPFNDQLTIDAEGIKDEQDFELISTIGQSIVKGKIIKGKNFIPTEKLSPGIYFLMLKQDHIVRYKLVKL